MAVPIRIRLVGERVELRPVALGDAGPLVELRRRSAAHLAPWMPAARGDELDLSSTRRRIRADRSRWRADRTYRFGIRERETLVLVGLVSLSEVVRGPFQNAYLGYWVGADHLRRGFATEGVRLALGFAFGPLALHRVQANVSPRNAASLGLLRRLGFREEGLARGYLELAGRWEDHVLLALTAEEWPAPGRVGPRVL